HDSIRAMISAALAAEAKPIPATNLSAGVGIAPNLAVIVASQREEAGSLKTVAASGLVPDLGRPHRILFQFLRGNSAPFGSRRAEALGQSMAWQDQRPDKNASENDLQIQRL